MKYIAWILVVWVVGSCISGQKKDSLFLVPFRRAYQDMMREHRLLTIVVTVVVIIILFKILF